MNCYVLILLTAIITAVQGHVFYETVNTDDGFCEGEDYGRIPVGGISYNNRKCIRYTCNDGQIIRSECTIQGIQGFPADCRLVRRRGHFPDCCPIVRCRTTRLHII
ncbi:U-scoloptoxin(16)-Er6a-like [Stegodyphus dumicola]|uniref:U-scoloptoxin(16)-Er6a-like n=1 Tax=Stegodyphus dumicola TaxID=202533 RepID=UPI0015ACE2A2|nr:U-scoloptoxin(16)-Er6a-like [Stegodyphus dumicola]